MKKVFSNFYVFSKFSLNLVLLLCVFFLIYLLYINYKNEDKVSKNQLKIENDLRENISQNAEFIQNISKEILETKTALINLEKIIKDNSTKESEVDLTAINESIDLLNKNFNILSSDISSLKNENSENQLKTNPELINQSVSEVIELIKIKYENSINFDKELNYLGTILQKDNTPALEKLSILKNNKYKGHIFLENQFKKEVNSYLKNVVSENDTFLKKIFLPYINLSPSSENIIVDEKILILEEVKFHIKNRNIIKAYNIMSSIDKHKDYFQLSFDEMKKYNSFVTQISRIE